MNIIKPRNWKRIKWKSKYKASSYNKFTDLKKHGEGGQRVKWVAVYAMAAQKLCHGIHLAYEHSESDCFLKLTPYGPILPQMHRVIAYSFVTFPQIHPFI